MARRKRSADDPYRLPDRLRARGFSAAEWRASVERDEARQPCTPHAPAVVEPWRCEGCRADPTRPGVGPWTPPGSAAAGRCLACGTPRPTA